MIQNCVKFLRQISFTQQFLRGEHKQIRKHKRVVNDPGISRRKQLVNDDHEFEQLTDYEFDLESDFTKVAQTHREHEREEEFRKEREKYLIVKQKYFKEKFPNFLTWSDKEQIRYLHRTDPDEWSFEKLSEGFPALPEVIAKIVKSSFTKKSNMIQNHDESVKANWKQFKEGSLNDLPVELVEHLKKFTERGLNLTSFERSEQVEIRKDHRNVKVGTEFVDIIKSYEKLKNKDLDSQSDSSDVARLATGDSSLVATRSSKSSNRHMTLEKFKEQLEKDSQLGKTTLDQEFTLRILEDKTNNVVPKASVSENVLEYPVAETLIKFDEKLVEGANSQIEEVAVNSQVEHFEKYEQREVSTTSNKMKSVDLVQYPEKIRIPKKYYKSGHTFKVNDCYYDDDGEFLYRVPGMYK